MRLFDLLMLLLLAAVFAPLERLRPASASGRTRASLRVDILHLLAGGMLIRLGFAAGAIALAALATAIVPQPLREAVRGQPLWLSIPQVLLLADLGFYAAHRLFHAVPWLWRLEYRGH